MVKIRQSACSRAASLVYNVKCGCGHVEDKTYEFDMPAAESDPKEEYVPGTCPECRAPIRIYLRRAKVQAC